MSLRILITGSRRWTDHDTIRHALTHTIDRWFADGGTGPVTVVHGDARGADTIAGRIAHELGCAVEAHPANWGRYGRRAGHRRNAEMVKASADICLAFPLDASPGTRGCIRAAQEAGIPVRIYNGTRERSR